MTLIIEKHPEFTRLSNYFKKIELIADDMGVEVDELLSDSVSVRLPSENQILSITHQRVKSLLSDSKKNESVL
jgi:hypothetical protein